MNEDEKIKDANKNHFIYLLVQELRDAQKDEVYQDSINDAVFLLSTDDKKILFEFMNICQTDFINSLE